MPRLRSTPATPESYSVSPYITSHHHVQQINQVFFSNAYSPIFNIPARIKALKGYLDPSSPDYYHQCICLLIMQITQLISPSKQILPHLTANIPSSAVHHRPLFVVRQKSTDAAETSPSPFPPWPCVSMCRTYIPSTYLRYVTTHHNHISIPVPASLHHHATPDAVGSV